MFTLSAGTQRTLSLVAVILCCSLSVEASKTYWQNNFENEGSLNSFAYGPAYASANCAGEITAEKNSATPEYRSSIKACLP